MPVLEPVYSILVKKTSKDDALAIVMGVNTTLLVSASDLSQQQLIQELEQALQKLQQDGPTLLCPLCNAVMSTRKGKFGMFYGCTAWSSTKCPGTRSPNGNVPEKIKQLILKKNKQSKKKSKIKNDVLDNLVLE